ncbi:protein of unassigned function [Methylobacterium oryzae CBMB20]|uniref:Protein of unassigned function n=1 Tax=Methylobacterium oryzae CBMB20 TaxID=693986 RepID=A0A089NXH5_9HYPH|nr:protein of unassigned function [Methylobacterium oryzae CBMB20]
MLRTGLRRRASAPLKRMRAILSIGRRGPADMRQRRRET